MTPQPKPVYIADPVERLLDMLAEEMLKVIVEEVENEQNNLP